MESNADRVTMSFPWRSQRSVRKHKDPITDNSFIDFNRSQKAPRKLTREVLGCN